MTKEEARNKAREVFGPSGQVCEHMQMKESLEPAVGVGFMEGGDLCIQGKGVTWEDAFAQAESRREKWQPRVPGRLDPREPPPDDLVNVKYQPTVPAEFIRVQISLEEQRLADLKRFQEQVRQKVRKKWGELKK